MMKVAIPKWRHRISPVLDRSQILVLFDLENGKEVGRIKIRMTHTDPLARARQISDLGVDVIICGAVSSILEIALVSAGINVISCKCGPVKEVLNAYMENKLMDSAFLMPGCGKQHQSLMTEVK
jgi:predicted Fe-Mo cluster-binding NifX family protein